MIINDFLTGEILASFWGLIAGTVLIVQFTKPIVKNRFNDIAVRVYTWAISLVLTFVFAKTGVGVQGILLTIINSIGVALASMGGYEVIADPRAEKERLDI